MPREKLYHPFESDPIAGDYYRGERLYTDDNLATEPWTVKEIDYHDRAEISCSMLNCLAKSPEQFESEYIIGNRRKSDAMEFGTAFHCAILEPARFAADYVVSPKFDMRTNVGKEGFKAFSEACRDKSIIDQPDFDLIQRMVASVRSQVVANGHVKRIGSESVAVEHEIYFERDGFECRCKLDYIDLDRKIIVDFKSIREGDIEPYRFPRFVIDYGLHRQAEWYRYAVKEEYGIDCEFHFVVVEKSDRPRTAVYRPSEEEYEIAEKENRKLLLELQSRRQSNDWQSSWRVGIQDLVLPKWAYDVDDQIVWSESE